MTLGRSARSIGSNRRGIGCGVPAGSQALPKLKAGVAAIFFGGGPVRGDPGGPSKPSALPQSDGDDLSCWNRELDLPLQFVADVEENGVCQRLRQVARFGRQELLVLDKILDEDPNPDLVLD